MAGEINLLPQRQYEAEQKEKVLRWIYLAITLLLVVDLIAVVSVFGYWTGKKIQINLTQGKIDKVETTIKGYKDVEILQQTLKQEANSVITIEKDKRDLNKALDKIAEITPDGVELDSFLLSQENGIDTKVVSRDPIVFSTFLMNLADETKGGKYFSDISSGSLSGTAAGVYSCSLSMKVKPGAFE